MVLPRSFNVIAAACDNMGIGFKGDIPWRLKKEMAYFTAKTSSCSRSEAQNAVIMGRKTWESIPSKYKPLAERYNIVISGTLQESGYDGVPVFKRLCDALDHLSQPSASHIETIWIIGGSALYKEALDSAHCEKVYLTRVKGDFPSDTFFPQLPDFYQEIKEEGVPSEVQEENGINYVYTVLKNTRLNGDVK